ncbi:MAG: L,D-transpeptidase [Pyrinomonadaceae bacterium]
MKSLVIVILAVLSLVFTGCTTQPLNSNSVTTNPTPSPAVSQPTEPSGSSIVTLPVLDALLSDDTFVKDLRSQLNLNDAQIGALKQAANEEIAHLRETNAEDSGGDGAEARDRALSKIKSIVGDEKTNQLMSFAANYWATGGEASTAGAKNERAPQANAVPTDTRVVVNIPAFRMDLFENGSIVKSYKIGIGYPQFPLPQGLRKAQTIIFNPTWTPPDSPWVAKMKDVSPGQKIEAGSKLNPLGPIKIPIGMPSLIHGGKSPKKLGEFASHGCVGLTTPQVKDFAKLLAEASGTKITQDVIDSYLRDPAKTRTVKLDQAVPVELRYETIVVEDGKLHIYKDVYDQDTNTEENLRKVLEANGARLEDLSADEKAQVLDALNTMSAHPTAKPSPAATSGNTNDKKSAKGKRAKQAKPPKELVIEVAALKGKGYPAAVNLDTGTGKMSSAAVEPVDRKWVRVS